MARDRIVYFMTAAASEIKVLSASTSHVHVVNLAMGSSTSGRSIVDGESPDTVEFEIDRFRLSN